MQYNLNQEQQEAVDHKNGPLLIIAGAGTGKTAVITQRIINIINKKWASTDEILALTYTEKAAKEMLGRVDQAMPYGYSEMTIATFHSFCDKILRQESLFLGISSNYALMTTAQSYVFFAKHLHEIGLKRLSARNNPESNIKAILSHFSKLQDENISISEYKKFAKSLPGNTLEEKDYQEITQELAQAYEKYSDLKQAHSKMDFSDLIALTIKLFIEHPQVLKYYRAKYKYILVDEFQDTNFAQNVLINLLASGLNPSTTDKKNANITVVGDDDQAIYKFRGAAISNILSFNLNYPTAKKIVLTRNYRSRQRILDVAHTLIKNNDPFRLEVTEKINKKLIASADFSDDQGGLNLGVGGENITSVPDLELVQSKSHPIFDPVTIFEAKTGKEEADYVSREILQLVKTETEERTPVLGQFNSIGQASFVDQDTLDLAGSLGKTEIGRDVDLEAGQANYQNSVKIWSDTNKDNNSPVKKIYSYSDIAILVRANSHADDFIQSFRNHDIPYRFNSPKGLYSRPEVQCLISFLRVLTNFEDDISFFNILMMPIWGLSGREIIEITNGAKSKREPIINFLEREWQIKLGQFSRKSEPTESNRDEIYSLPSENVAVSNENESQYAINNSDTISQDEQNGSYSNTQELREISANNITKYIQKILSPKSITSISNLLQIIDYSIGQIVRGESVGELLYNFVKHSDYLESMTENPTAENEFKIQNISKLFSIIASFEKDNPGTNIYDFIKYLDYSIEIGEIPSTETDIIPEYDGVNIMTVHSAKGLEFPVVFLVNLVNGRFPSRDKKDPLPIPPELIKETIPDQKDIEESLQEERRLFYVGLTRARERLYLTRSTNYNDGKMDWKRSRFIDECIPDNLDELLVNEVSVAEGKSSIEIDSTHIQFAPEIVRNIAQYDDLSRFDSYQYKSSKFSYSQLNTYENCPKLYRYRYVLGIPGKPSATLSFGSSIHNALRDFNVAVQKAQQGFEGFNKFPTVEDLLRFYEDRWIGQGYKSKRAETNRKKEGRDCMVRYYEEFFNPDKHIVAVEQPFSYKIGSIDIGGKIDRIDVSEVDSGLNMGNTSKNASVNLKGKTINESNEIPVSDSLEVLDYKTGNAPKDRKVDDNLQLAIYTLATELTYGKKVDKIALFYVEDGLIIQTTPTEKDKQKAISRIKELTDKINTADFHATPGFACRYCDYRDICSSAQI